MVYYTGMWRKIAKYSLLSVSSFFFFTGVLQAVAHAQTLDPLSASHALSSPTPTRTESVKATPTPPPLPTPSIESNTNTTGSEDLTNAKTTPTPTTAPTEPPTIVPTAMPTTVPTSTPTATPTPQTSQTTTGDGIADQLFSLVNAHRQSLGLAQLQKDEKTCKLAQDRAPEIAAEMAAGTLHSGMYGRNLPYWNTENAIAYGSAEADFNWWMSDSIHRQAIESKVHTTSCVACSGIYCVEEFTSYQPK